jgi:hypothetical protein
MCNQASSIVGHRYGMVVWIKEPSCHPTRPATSDQAMLYGTMYIVKQRGRQTTAKQLNGAWIEMGADDAFGVTGWHSVCCLIAYMQTGGSEGESQAECNNL